MKVLADEGIPCAKEAFAALGETTLVPGRSLGADSLRDCDVLFVRSVTRVDADLLRGSRVRFVGTATIGTDHVDLDFLREAGVGFCDAKGSNANSVAEYVVCALLCLARRRGVRLAGRSLGVVGVGAIGRRVASHAETLGMRVLRNDPPRARAEGPAGFCDLAEALAADFVTLHVPLTRSGRDATLHLLDARRLAALRPHTLLLNTSRGAVVDNGALREALGAGALSGAVLDVWEGEPLPDARLMDAVTLGTPHIAGYSLDGKLAGTEQVARAACRHFGVQSSWSADSRLPRPERERIALAAELDVEEALRRASRAAYDVERDDAAMRELLCLPDRERAAAFDRLRKHYPVRREFRAFAVETDSPGLRAAASRLGFAAFATRPA